MGKIEKIQPGDYVDVLIVGAGLSGIGAAYHLKDKCPGKSFGIIEQRAELGGTWDLFKYPGIRSDSDMHTLGFKFKPWLDKKSIADGPRIWDYLNETARENHIREHIRFNHKMVAAHWSTETATWSVEVTADGVSKWMSCNFLFMCSGYYSYDQGHEVDFPGQADFKGDIYHPQKWTEGIDYKDKTIVIIGSGATAVTLVPAMAKQAKHITMLQRSPTYMVVAPDSDWIANTLRKIMPNQWAYNIVRKKNIIRQHLLYTKSQSHPEKVKKYLLGVAQKRLGKDYKLDPNFTPSYGPWDQRMCLIPNGDLFDSVKDGDASIVTDHIERFTETGIALKSGKEIPADMIVTATGIKLEVLGGAEFFVDGETIDFADKYSYEAMMMSDVPNMATVFGYVNASWTLRSDIIAEYVCRLINHMDTSGNRQCTPIAPEGMARRPWIDFEAGYIQRVIHLFPSQGDQEPWLNTQNYMRDKKVLESKDVDDGHMIFSNPANQIQEAAE